MQAGEIIYDVEIETRGLLRGEREATQALDNLDGGMQKVERSSKNTANSMSGLAKAISAVITAQALRSMADMVQRYQTMSERVEMATQSQAEFELVSRRLQATADGTYRSLDEAQELYIQTSSSLRSMGYEAEQMLDITDSMSFAFVKSATTTDRARVAMGAFSRSLAKGRVDADAWEMMLVSIPDIADQLSASMGRSAQEVRALGAAGKLTTRDLTEGLRNALVDNKRASDEMATDMVDASVRVRNAITVMLVGLEAQTGAIQGVTDGIIMASEYILAMGNDAEALSTILDGLTLAGASLASIFAGRLVTSMLASAGAFYTSTVAAAAKARANVVAAETAVVLAAQELVVAQTAERAARGLSTHAAAAATLATAERTATAATTAHTGALAAQAATAGVAGAALRGLRSVMMLLGGPAGIILLAASALLVFSGNARSAADASGILAGSIGRLTSATLEFKRTQMEQGLEDQSQAAARAARDMASFQKQIDDGMRGRARLEQQLSDAQGRFGEASDKANEYRQALEKLDVELERRAAGADVGPQVPEGWTPERLVDTGGAGELTAFQKLEQAMENQIALAKQSGRARAELAALQRLGADATDEERARVAELATELHGLETAQKAAEEARKKAEQATEDGIKSYEENETAIRQMQQALNDTALSEFDLIEAQAMRSLNADATRGQVEQMRALAVATRMVAEQEKAREDAKKLQEQATAADPRAAAANQYATQLEQYRLFKEAQLLTDVEYDELRNAAATQYEQARLDAQEQVFRAQSEGNAFLMDSIDALGQASTNVMSSLLSGTMNTREAVQALAKTIFDQAVGAIVEMGVQQVKSLIMGQTAAGAAAGVAAATGSAVAAAWAPAAAAVSLATLGANSGPAIAGIAATSAAATAMTSAVAPSGRQYGGPTAAGGMYRINEGGAPEVFNAANGMQYMMANQRGEVVSNADASRGGTGGVNVTVQLFNDPSRAGQVEQERDGPDEFIRIWVANVLGDGEAAQAMEAKYGLNTQGI